ncbi:MAG: hypothetical protein J5892_01175 [Bacilli bacterium]|nr:hypothetical protein [Bacilli bacterium]
MNPWQIMGVLAIPISDSVHPLKATEEWCRWLNYLSKSDDAKFNELSNKTDFLLTKNDSKWLEQVKLERRIATKLRPKKELTKEEIKEINAYFEKASIEELIKRKLTKEEYKSGLIAAKDFLANHTESEARDWCALKINNYKSLTMVESFILREIQKHLYFLSFKKFDDEVRYQLTANRAMRNRSESAAFSSTSVIK